MIPSAQNKMAGSLRSQRTTVVTGETGQAEELIRCRGCSHLVMLPYGGQVTCPECRHEMVWLNRYHKPRTRIVQPIERLLEQR